MITTIDLVNIIHLTYLHNFFLVIRTFKIYSPSNFQIYSKILLTFVTKLYTIYPERMYLITGSLYLLTYVILMAFCYIRISCFSFQVDF